MFSNSLSKHSFFKAYSVPAGSSQRFLPGPSICIILPILFDTYDDPASPCLRGLFGCRSQKGRAGINRSRKKSGPLTLFES